VTEIANHYGPKLGRKIDPMTEVLVTCGANGALCSFFQALVNPGDEVVTFEPMFQMYIDHMQLVGATLKGVPLEVDKNRQWVFDPKKLRKALTKKTKLLILNSPQNPSGKCFSKKEMLQITESLKDYPDVVVMSDEVYDFLTFDKTEHVRYAALGNNWERTITVYSGGKLFNATGWKIGWAIATPKLLKLGGIINNTITYSCNTPGQVAMAKSLP
jgi:aspartate/methionine/tyrosine aminotransferase